MTPEQKKYKEDQKLRIAELQAGKKDMNGNEISKILVKANEYVIYEISTTDISDCLKVYMKKTLEG